MIITLIGMSGAGKSYWSTELEKIGFTRFGCDDLITKELAWQFSYNNPDEFDMHAWVGYPDETNYAEHARQYLQIESKVLKNIMEYLDNVDHEQNIVIDSTGSIIYMQPEIISRLQKSSIFVYLDITPKDMEKMLAYYLSNPVAIIWDAFYKPKPGETRLETFERCYPLLIKSREQKYRELAQLIIPSRVHKEKETRIEHFLDFIESNLE